MAYRKKSYKRKARRSNKRRAPRRLSKHMVRAIKAISQIPVETKSYPKRDDFQTVLASSGYLGSGDSWLIRRNIFSDIPRADNTITKGEQSFIGNEVQCRGFRIQINLYTYNATALGLDTVFRFSVYHENAYAGGLSTLSTSNYIFDQDQNTTPTWLFWNPQIAKVIYRRTFSLSQMTQVNRMVNKKFWIPLRKKVVSAEEESNVVNSFMGKIKGEQYYWVLEMLQAGASSLTNIAGNIGSRVYFKDA